MTVTTLGLSVFTLALAGVLPIARRPRVVALLVAAPWAVALLVGALCAPQPIDPDCMELERLNDTLTTLPNVGFRPDGSMCLYDVPEKCAAYYTGVAPCEETSRRQLGEVTYNAVLTHTPNVCGRQTRDPQGNIVETCTPPNHWNGCFANGGIIEGCDCRFYRALRPEYYCGWGWFRYLSTCQGEFDFSNPVCADAASGPGGGYFGNWRTGNREHIPRPRPRG